MCKQRHLQTKSPASHNHILIDTSDKVTDLKIAINPRIAINPEGFPKLYKLNKGKLSKTTSVIKSGITTIIMLTVLSATRIVPIVPLNLPPWLTEYITMLLYMLPILAFISITVHSIKYLQFIKKLPGI
jgi:hypothetical protein